MLTVHNDEPFSMVSGNQYRIIRLQYPRYLDFYNAVAAVEVTLPTGEIMIRRYMVSLLDRHAGTIMLEDRIVPFRWDGVIHSPVKVGHYF